MEAEERRRAPDRVLVEGAQHPPARALAIDVRGRSAWRSAGRRAPRSRSPRARPSRRARRGRQARGSVVMRPGAGRKPADASSALMRHSIACPAKRTSSWRNESGSPAAIEHLLAHEVETGDELRDRVLDLDARVHLQEVVLAVAGEEALDRPGAAVADGARGVDGDLRRSARAARASTAGDGVSSTSFWWRRWIVQSRSPRWTTLPCASARTCTSTWRGSSR